MPHPADFADAHSRHWQDAERLFDKGRWANADQLYGLSVECGLKAVLETAGVAIKGKYREHVQDLWPEFVNFARGRQGANYMSKLPEGEPFKDWSHHDRYAHSRHFVPAVVDPHRDATRKVRDMVQDAIQGG